MVSVWNTSADVFIAVGARVYCIGGANEINQTLS